MFNSKNASRKVIFSCGTLLLFGTSVSFAADAAPTDEYNLEDLLNIQVTTASKQAQGVKRAPATVRVISEKEIKERGYKDLKDIFVDLPGFDVSYDVAGESRTLAIARGLVGENKLIVMRNGKKLNATTGERLVLGNNMPLFDVKRIEVIYGPSSAMYGADAYSGIINIITKDATDMGGNVIADVSYGSWKTKDVGLMAGKKFSDDVALTSSFRFFDSDNYNRTKDYTEWKGVTPYSMPIRDYNLDLTLKLKDLTVSFYRADAKEPNTGTNPEWYIFNKDHMWRQKQDRLSVDHSYQGKGFTLGTTISYEDYSIDKESGFNYIPSRGGKAFKYGRNDALQFSQQLNAPISDSTQLVAGYAVEAVNAFPKGNNLTSPFSRPDLVDFVTYPDNAEIPVEFRNKTISFGSWPYYSWGVYGEVTHQFSSDLQVNVGGRFDYNTDYKGYVTPRAGVIWDPFEKTNLKLLYSSSVIKPSRYLALEHWNGGNFVGVYPNQGLKPEKLNTFAFNVEQLVLNDKVKLGLNTYYNLITDLIQPVGGLWQKNANQGEPYTYGFELTADAAITRDLTAFAYYSYLNAKQDGGVRNLNKVAQHKGNLGFTYTLFDKLSISPRMRLSSGVYKLTSAAGDVAELPGFATVDLSARYNKITDFLSAYVTVRNLLNRKYYTASPFGEGPSGWITPEAAQPGIYAEVGTTWTF